MRTSLLLIVCFLTCTVAMAQQAKSPNAAPTPFLVVKGSPEKVEKDANDAAAKGYRMVAGWHWGTAHSAGTEMAVLHHGGIDEPYTYLALRKQGLPEMEKALNQAAAEGFHLLPQGVIRVSDRPEGMVHLKTDDWVSKRTGGEPLVAFMEKTPRSAKTEYRVLGFRTVYQVKGEISGRLTDDDADAKLAAAANAGYRVVQLLTRLPAPEEAKSLLQTLLSKDGPPRIPQEVIVIFEKETDAPADAAPRAARYHLVIAIDPEKGTKRDRGVSALNEALNASGSAGYHLLAISRESYPVMAAIVERNASGSPAAAYAVLTPFWSDIAKNLTKASPAGWALHPQGAIDGPDICCPGHGYLWLVTERAGSSSDTAEYLVINEIGSGLAKRLNQAEMDGYGLVNIGPIRDDPNFVIAVLRRPKPAH